MEDKQLYEKIGNEYKQFVPIADILAIIDKTNGLTAKDLFNMFNHIKLEWKGDVISTRLSVPTSLRHNGLYISYNNGNGIITEYYVGSSMNAAADSVWQKDEYWLNASQAAGLVDEEDITEKNSKLSFKDREYKPSNFSGLGRIILRKNLTEVGTSVKNVLTQDMINKENTIYEIRYDFDLNGQEITIPEGCVLDFQGGSLNNGRIICNNTIIKGSFKGNADINSTYYNYNYIIPKNTDVTDLLQKILDENNFLYLEKGTYLISKPLVIKKGGATIIGESVSSDGSVIKPLININSLITTRQTEEETSSTHKVLSYINFKNIHIYGNNLAKNGIECVYDSNCYFENVRVTGCTIGLKIHGWSHSFIHCSTYGNKIGGFFNNAFNQCSFIGCFFNTNSVGFYAEGTNVLFYGCDIERNSAIGCICSGSSVEVKECYFESNSTEGIIYSSNYQEEQQNCYYYPNGGNIFTQVLKSDIILRVNPRIKDNGSIALGFSNAWLADNVNISNCYFNSKVDCAVIGSVSKVKITDNVFEDEYPCVFGIIPSYNATIIKQMEIYNNYVDRANSDNAKLKPVKSIKPFYDSPKTNYLFWNFLQNNSHKIYTGCAVKDFGKNIYNFNGRVKSGEGHITTSKVRIENYNKKEVIYKANLYNIDQYEIGFHRYANDGSMETGGLIPDTIYCFEAELKLSRDVFEEEKIYFNFANSSIHIQKYEIKNLNTVDYVKVYYHIYYDGNMLNNWFESTFNGLNIQDGLSLYIRNPKFYNLGMEEDNSDYYFSYLKYASRSPTNYNRPYTCGVRVGERMSYFGSDETLKNRNLVCINTGLDNNCDTWADVTYDFNASSNTVPKIKIETNPVSAINNGVYNDKPQNVNIGFAYFCTDRQTSEGTTDGIMIYHKGNNVWVDSLGRTIK